MDKEEEPADLTMKSPPSGHDAQSPPSENLPPSDSPAEHEMDLPPTKTEPILKTDSVSMSDPNPPTKEESPGNEYVLSQGMVWGREYYISCRN